MRLQHWIASALVALGVASCGENAAPTTQQQSQTTLGQQQQVAQNNSPQGNRQAGPSAPVKSVAAPARQQGKQAVSYDAPIPPADAQWTIFCDSIDGVGHVENAGIMRSRLIQLTGMHDWYVVHGEKDSKIYYGYYRSLDNPAEKRRAEADRLKIANLTDRLGNRVVRAGVLEPVTLPDPVAPAAWNLLNAPKNGYWSIEIATFSGNPKRKAAAVQAVRELRQRGETEAYFYHGETASSVCIGAWPRDAVAEQGTGLDKQGNMRDDAHTPNADQPLLVFNDTVPNLAARVLEPGTGKPMAVQAPKLDILDPDMKKKVKEYPYHAVNYEYHGVSNSGETYPDPSVLVVIPHDAASANDDSWRLTGGQPGGNTAPAAAPPHAAPAGAGDNVLRSIGDK
ncbi:MAG TPA: hypothetical protein VGI81_28200 [Tepidisphaeraceae bacterium]|jgi:hypothetical protein